MYRSIAIFVYFVIKFSFNILSTLWIYCNLEHYRARGKNCRHKISICSLFTILASPLN